MKILLIQPKLDSDTSFFKRFFSWLDVFPSLALEQLGGVTPEYHEIEIQFEEFDNIDFGWDGDLVGISCVTPMAPHVYEIADKFRKKGIKVVLGGWHPSALPEEAKEHADSVIIGEAENNWLKLLKDLEQNSLKSFYRNKQPVDLRNIPLANRNLKRHINFTAVIQATRGCPIGCEFCALGNSSDGHVFRQRPIEKVVEEIKSIKQRNLYFYDPSLTIDIEYTKKLFQSMRGLNKKFNCFGNIDILGKNEKLLKVASEAGCASWFIGFESVSQKVINYLGKKTNRVKEYSSSIKKIHDYGMMVVGSFIFGFDQDTYDVFDKTLQMVYELEIDGPTFTILTPYPGTPLFKRLEQEGRILTKDWSKYTQKGNVVFQPKQMTSMELLEGTAQVMNEIGSLRGSIRRVIKNPGVITRVIKNRKLVYY